MKKRSNPKKQAQSIQPQWLIAAAQVPVTAVTLKAATKEFGSRKDLGLYGEQVFGTISSFAERLPTTPLNGVVSGMIQDFLFSTGLFKDLHQIWKLSTMEGILRRFQSFFRWALPHYGYHSAPNPAHGVNLPLRLPDIFAPLDLAENQRLLDAYWEFEGGIYTPSLLLSVRCAARHLELRRFQLRDFNKADNSVFLGDEFQRRVELVGSTGFILSLLEKRGVLCQASFGPSKCAVQKIVEKANLASGRLQPNTLRGTALCYYLALCQNLVQTAAWGGVSAEVFRKMFQMPVPQSSAEPFWQMVPGETRCYLEAV